MRSRKTSSPISDSSLDDTSPSQDLELAEAEAQEAEAVAAAARAKARAIRLRREAEARARGESEPEDVPADADPAGADEAEVDEAEVDKSSVDAEEQADVDELSGTAEDGTAEQEPRRRFRSPSGRTWKLVAGVVSAVLTVALLTASGLMLWHHRSVQAEQRRAGEFAAAARQGVVTLMSLDYNHAKEDVQRIIDSSTGEFKKDFEASADDFTKVAQSSKAITKSTVNATAVDSMTDDSAVVLVAASSTVTNTAGAKQDPRNWRLSVTVNRDGDQIKLSKVEFVP